MTGSERTLPASVAPENLISRADGFLFNVTTHEDEQNTFAQAKFDIASYDPELFNTLSVEAPGQLDNAVPKRQAEFLAGRLVARIALKRAYDIPIGPYRAPVWPRAMNGSITHSQGRCAALVTDNAVLCGIDMEQVVQGAALDAILQRCVSPQERVWMESQDFIPAETLATLIFSAKESIFKALFPIVGRFFGFECAEVLPKIRDETLSFRLTEDLDIRLPKGFEIPVNYKATEGFILTKVLLPRA